MCGIVGALEFERGSFSITETYIRALRDTLAHRGPDGAGAWIAADGRVGLGHRRLSIIDLSPEAGQPMSNEDGTIQIVFNGEIYNHAEVRTELEKVGGHSWRTDHSDTEVILHAFEEWGIACLARFRGMFAFALWDGRKDELWLVRDRLGIKPLYYSIHHGRIVFASEIKALLRDPEQARELDEEAFFHYLSFLTTPAPMTMFKGIRKIPAGCWLRINSQGDTEEHRYWDALERYVPVNDQSEEAVAADLLEELRTAVRLHKESDVPVGIFLSGGIDSSTNAALFSQTGGQVKTFTIGYEGQYASYRNELHHARRMANLVGAEHHERLLCQDDLLTFLPRMIELQDEPIADPVCVPVYYVSLLAREHGVKVCQVGEGSDELFGGYPIWESKLRAQRLGDLLPRPLKEFAMALLRIAGRETGLAFEALRRSARGEPVFWSGAEAFTDARKRRILSPRLRAKFEGRTSWEALEPIRRRFEARAGPNSGLLWMTYVDLNLRLPELLLMRVDKMAMGVSLEGRVPFLDHKLVELAMNIPERMKMNGRELKHILKKAVRGTIPDDIIDRPKQGFGVPIYEWFFEELGVQARRELEQFCDKTDLFDREEVLRLLEERKHPQAWYLLNFVLWWNTYIEATTLPRSLIDEVVVHAGGHSG